jgi:hypothetical protein
MTRAADDVRRRAPRIATRLDGTLSGRTARPVTVVDLSATGCLVKCTGCPEPGSILDLEISLSDGPFRAKARVADASVDGSSLPTTPPSHLAGLEFLGLPVQDEVRLLRYLEQERRKQCAPEP